MRKQSPRGVLWKTYENSQENTWVGVSFSIKLKAGDLQLYEKETLAQMFSCEFLQSLRTNTSWTACWNNMYQSMHMYFSEYMCYTGTLITFVRISTDTISSLTMHFINQFSKQTRWLRWKNQMCIRGKNSIISIIPLFQIPLSWVW